MVLSALDFRRHHGNNHNRSCSIEEAEERREFVVLSRSQRLKGADVFGKNVRAHVTIPPASRARST